MRVARTSSVILTCPNSAPCYEKKTAEKVPKQDHVEWLPRSAVTSGDVLTYEEHVSVGINVRQAST